MLRSGFSFKYLAPALLPNECEITSLILLLFKTLLISLYLSLKTSLIFDITLFYQMSQQHIVYNYLNNNLYHLYMLCLILLCQINYYYI